MPLAPDEVDAQRRQEAGRRAALIAARVDGEQVAEKPTGDTSPDNYPYTYWWVVGWNAGVAELAGQ